MKTIITAIFCLISINCFSQDTITASQAKDYMDKIVCVKGKAVSFKEASEGRNINYINIDKPYPDNIFTVVITTQYLERLKLKFEDVKNKIIYIKGKITTYKNDPNQIPQIYNPISIEIKKP